MYRMGIIFVYYMKCIPTSFLLIAKVLKYIAKINDNELHMNNMNN